MNKKREALQELARLLDENDALGNFVEAVKTQGKISSYWEDAVDYAIDRSITWRRTKQGESYWQDKHAYVRREFKNELRHVKVSFTDLCNLEGYLNSVKEKVDL